MAKQFSHETREIMLRVIQFVRSEKYGITIQKLENNLFS